MPNATMWYVMSRVERASEREEEKKLKR